MNYGDILHVTNKAVSKWERGASIPDIEILKEMSDYFGVSIQELLDGEKKATPPQELSTEQIKTFIKESNSQKSPVKKGIESISWIWVIFILGIIIFGLWAFSRRDEHPYSQKQKQSDQIIQNQYALVPDRMVYKNQEDNYFILTEKDSNFNQIYNLITQNLTYKNTGSTLTLEEIDSLKEEYSFVEFDYNTKSKNRIFLLDCPDIAMIDMTGEEGKIAREKLQGIGSIQEKLNLATIHQESLSTENDFEYDIAIQNFPKLMSKIPDKIYGVRYKQVDQEELEEFIDEYSLDIDLGKIDFETQNIIVTYYNRERITKLDKCIGHLSYYFTPEYGDNRLNIQVVSKIYNADCIYCYDDYPFYIYEPENFSD